MHPPADVLCGMQVGPPEVSAEREAVDEAAQAIEEDRRVAVGFLRAPWPPLDAFLRLDGPALMLELVLASPGERRAPRPHPARHCNCQRHAVPTSVPAWVSTQAALTSACAVTLTHVVYLLFWSLHFRTHASSRPFGCSA